MSARYGVHPPTGWLCLYSCHLSSERPFQWIINSGMLIVLLEQQITAQNKKWGVETVICNQNYLFQRYFDDPISGLERFDKIYETCFVVKAALKFSKVSD